MITKFFIRDCIFDKVFKIVLGVSQQAITDRSASFKRRAHPYTSQKAAKTRVLWYSAGRFSNGIY